MGTVGVAIRMVISLAAVLCLLFVLARFARRGRPRGDGPDMTVLSRCSVGSKASVAVVQLGERALVVGVTEQSVTLLSETSTGALMPAAAAPEPLTEADQVVVRRVVVDGPSRPSRRAAKSRAATSRAATSRAATTAPAGKLSGSVLAPDTWRRTVDAVREMTVRR